MITEISYLIALWQLPPNLHATILACSPSLPECPNLLTSTAQQLVALEASHIPKYVHGGDLVPVQDAALLLKQQELGRDELLVA